MKIPTSKELFEAQIRECFSLVRCQAAIPGPSRFCGKGVEQGSPLGLSVPVPWHAAATGRTLGLST